MKEIHCAGKVQTELCSLHNVPESHRAAQEINQSHHI